MATTEKPKSRLPDGRVNPDYTAWRKANKVETPEVFKHETGLPAVETDFGAVVFAGGDPEAIQEAIDQAAEPFQSAAEPEQTTSDDPREPEVAPALENLSLRVVALARNNAFVYCDLNGDRVPVVVKKGDGPRRHGREIPVKWDEEAGHYIHTP